MKSILIKDTTREERIRIVHQALWGACGIDCEFCSGCDNRGGGRIDKADAGYVTAVKVFPVDHSASYHVVSFIALENDRIVSLDEYWSDDGEAPEWRKKLGIGVPIHGKKEGQP